MRSTYKFEKMPLPYGISSLAPEISEKTVRLHYGDVLSEYIDALNETIAPFASLHSATLRELIVFSPRVPQSIRRRVRDLAGAVFNHNLYFYGLSPDICGAPSKGLARAIDRAFGGFENMLSEMKDMALSCDIGWVFLACDKSKNAKLVFCPRNETVLTMNLTPILAFDAWEHAAFCDCGTDRGEHFDRWAKHINRHFAEEMFLGD